MSGPFERALGEALRGAAERDLAGPRRRSGRRWRRIAAAGVAAAGASVAAILASTSGPVSADLKITVADHRVDVLLEDLDNSPDEVQQALRDAGLNVIVIGQATGPSEVGRFTGYSSEGDDHPEDLRLVDERGQTFTGFSIPEGYSGQLTLTFGRAAESGEGYVVSTDAFAPGEPLHCAGVLGARLSEVGPATADLDVRIGGMLNGERRRLKFGDAVQTEWADWFVVGGQMFSAEEVVLDVTPDPVLLSLEPPCP